MDVTVSNYRVGTIESSKRGVKIIAAKWYGCAMCLMQFAVRCDASSELKQRPGYRPFGVRYCCWCGVFCDVQYRPCRQDVM